MFLNIYSLFNDEAQIMGFQLLNYLINSFILSNKDAI